MDENMKKLLNALSEAVHQSLTNSNAFIEAMSAMWRSGQEASAAAEAETAQADCEMPEITLMLTPEDEHFLRTLKIAAA